MGCYFHYEEMDYLNKDQRYLSHIIFEGYSKCQNPYVPKIYMIQMVGNWMSIFIKSVQIQKFNIFLNMSLVLYKIVLKL